MTLRVPLGIALAIIVLSAHSSRAECAFPHPAKAKRFRAELVQAFVGCGSTFSGPTPNAETESGVPSCYPAETFAQFSGSPAHSWTWGPKARGSVALAAAGGDVVVSATLAGARDESTAGLATGNAVLAFVVRSTLVDPMSGGMTVIDFPFAVPFPVGDGKGKIKTALSALPSPLSGGLTGSCRSMEVEYVALRDPSGTIFADVGVYLH